VVCMCVGSCGNIAIHVVLCCSGFVWCACAWGVVGTLQYMLCCVVCVAVGLCGVHVRGELWEHCNTCCVVLRVLRWVCVVCMCRGSCGNIAIQSILYFPDKTEPYGVAAGQIYYQAKQVDILSYFSTNVSAS
jgi:hypothetical protein